VGLGDDWCYWVDGFEDVGGVYEGYEFGVFGDDGVEVVEC